MYETRSHDVALNEGLIFENAVASFGVSVQATLVM